MKVNGFLSEEFLYKIGVCKGCIISPLLLNNNFVDDITNILQSENIGVKIGDIVLYISLYAHGIILIPANDEDLQVLVKKNEDFL